jgi:DNA-directed RNA polymerase specialized sigma24 family protein
VVPGDEASAALEEVAAVVSARRELLLRVHAFRLRREDLEDCYGQATLELMLRARRGGRFADAGHIANALEQRFLSRIHDRRRALAGRSPMEAALEGATSLSEPASLEIDVIDRRAEIEPLLMRRQELRRVGAVAHELSADQRLALACEIALQMQSAEFCARFGWTPAKYRKVTQRGRARLRRLMEGEE